MKKPYPLVKKNIVFFFKYFIPKSSRIDINYKSNKEVLKKIIYTKKYIEETFISFTIGSSSFVKSLNEIVRKEFKNEMKKDYDFFNFIDNYDLDDLFLNRLFEKIKFHTSDEGFQKHTFKNVEIRLRNKFNKRDDV